MPIQYKSLPYLHLARHTDWFTDDLFMIESAEHFVFPYSRLYADMERLYNDPLEAQGMGIFYTQTPWGVTYRDKSLPEYEDVMKLYQQWHENLKHAAEKQVKDNRYALLVDCHSFSHHQVPQPESELPDINIGTNAVGSSRASVDLITHGFESQGYSVAVDRPYQYSIAPIVDDAFETVMIEINKRCYLTEDFQRSTDYKTTKQAVQEIMKRLMAYEQEQRRSQ
jgi:N-formylglutamate amidohydrolase